MSRSPYIDSVVLTPKHSGKRTEKVQAFVIHHMTAKWTGKRCAEYFRDTPSRQASANYCIGYDGDVALNVEEENRAWTSSSNWADQRAITYELANSTIGGQWEVSDKTLRKAIIMLAEQHKRYGLKKATYTGDTSGTLWRHDWFVNTNCPGPYLGSKLPYMADEINKILNQSEPIVAGAKVEKPKTDKQLADEVIKGIHGTGAERKAKLGSRYDAVQKLIDEMFKPKPVVKPKPVPKPVTNKTVADTYKESATFYPNDTIIVRNAPSTSATIVARYYKGEHVKYHTVHLKNGYVWLQYTRGNGQQAYIPCRTYSNGKYGPLWGIIK
ncbi:N-acetylmuramoyl-L-alanine amidase [Jeotgalibaca porci]|uniref:N-acetylmuramoyl-L-alanine amidase n=1 Tax=Jeotgalibaca porci TaxID=1868793 RepID=UPI0035A0AEB9